MQMGMGMTPRASGSYSMSAALSMDFGVLLTRGSEQVDILERHPFTTQTFIPLGLSHSDELTNYIVIVAPSLPTNRGAIFGAPDLNHVRAFVASGDQAVTYSPGTWHAPMVVVGDCPVDFVVMQFVNGVKNEDTQEVKLAGPDLHDAREMANRSAWNEKKGKEGIAVVVDRDEQGRIVVGKGAGSVKAKM